MPKVHIRLFKIGDVHTSIKSFLLTASQMSAANDLISQLISRKIIKILIFYTFTSLNMLKSESGFLSGKCGIFFGTERLQTKNTLMNKFSVSQILISTGLLFFKLHCTQIVPLVKCDPVVVFSGVINGDYQRLIGNCSWENQCKLSGDTLRMYFYSENFQEVENIRDGDLIRMDIFPGDGQLIGTARVLFHMARYHEKNSSYTVCPADTLFTHSAVKMQSQMTDIFSSEQILLDNIYIRSPPEPGTYGEILEIKDGIIQGVIQ